MRSLSVYSAQKREEILREQNLPCVFSIESNTAICTHANGETLIKPPIVSVAVQQHSTKVIDFIGVVHVNFVRFRVEGQNKGGTFDCEE